MLLMDDMEWEYVLSRGTVLVSRVALRLSAPFLVALDRTKVGDLDDDTMERTCEAGGVGIFGACDGEATPACVSCTETWG